MNLTFPRTLKPGNEAQVIHLCTSAGNYKSCYLMRNFRGAFGQTYYDYFSVNRYEWSDAEIGELVRWAQRYTTFFRKKAVPVLIANGKRKRRKQ